MRKKQVKNIIKSILLRQTELWLVQYAFIFHKNALEI